MRHSFELRWRAAIRQLSSIGLTWLLIVIPTQLSAADAYAKAQLANSAQTIQEKVLDMPAGSLVQVQLLSKVKLRGQISNITKDGFIVKTAMGNSIEDKQVAFAEVKSIKQVDKGRSPSFWILVGVGIFFAVAAIVAGTVGQS